MARLGHVGLDEPHQAAVGPALAEVAAAVKALTSILEPVMIILVGGIVGFIVVAMYMPMFKVYDAIPTQ